jgi:hypothetical protein
VTDNSSLTVANLGGLKVRKAAESKKNPTALIYGEGGTGKTTLAATAADVPDLCPVLHLNIENGADSIASRSNIEVVDIDTIRELQSVFAELYNKSGAGYNTVIADNLTEAQAQGMDDILKTGKGMDFVDFEGASFSNGAWNQSSQQMRKLMRYFRDLPVYTIFVAWEKDYAKDNEPANIGPHFTKTFGGEAPGLVNDVYRLSLKGGERVLQTAKTDRVSAKDRSGLLPPIIRNPTMNVLNDYWTGKLVKPTAEELEAAKKSSVLTNKKR